MTEVCDSNPTAGRGWGVRAKSTARNTPPSWPYLPAIENRKLSELRNSRPSNGVSQALAGLVDRYTAGITMGRTHCELLLGLAGRRPAKRGDQAVI